MTKSASLQCSDWNRSGSMAHLAVAPNNSARRRSGLARIGTIFISRAGWLKPMTLHTLGGIVVALALAGVGAKAEDRYPSKPVRIVVSFAAGGPTDTVARVMGTKMGELLGQQFVVENRTGAGGKHAINPGLYKKMPYDPVRDFAPIGQVGVTPTLLGVHPSVPATDVKSLVTLVKENPGKFTYGSSGLGSILHLCGEQFKALAGGVNAVHVPYRGSAPMMSDLVGGQISMAFDAN